MNKNEIKYIDNEIIRSISTPTFNFTLDKESKVSVCWGKDVNDDPLYDPISPQELTFLINSNTTLESLITNINILANVQQELELNHLQKITNLNNINQRKIKPLTTIANVILNLENNDDSIIKISQQFIEYINKFNIPIELQLNNPINQKQIQQFKFMTPNIIINIKSDMINTYQLLKNNNFNIDAKFYLNKDSFTDILSCLDKLDKNIKGKIYILNKNIITKKQLTIFENKIKDLNLSNIFLSSCHLLTFNNKKPFNHIIPIIPCDSCTFSLYIKNNEILPCDCNLYKSLHTLSNQNDLYNDIWYNNNIQKFRDKIINQSCC